MLSASVWVEITIRVDESDCLSVTSSHDQETERFLSTGPTGRRVSFNEAALFDHGKKAQEKGRRSDSQPSTQAEIHISKCLFLLFWIQTSLYLLNGYNFFFFFTVSLFCAGVV